MFCKFLIGKQLTFLYHQPSIEGRYYLFGPKYSSMRFQVGNIFHDIQSQSSPFNSSVLPACSHYNSEGKHPNPLSIFVHFVISNKEKNRIGLCFSYFLFCSRMFPANHELSYKKLSSSASFIQRRSSFLAQWVRK